MSTEHCTLHIDWSDEDQAYVATFTEFPALSWIATRRHDAITGAALLLADVLEDLDKENGES